MAPVPANPVKSQLEDIVNSVRSALRGRAGRLVAITLAAPPGEDWSALVTRDLRSVGLGEVEVEVRSMPGPLRLLTLEFVR